MPYSIRLDDDLDSRINEIIKATGTSKADILRKAITMYVDRFHAYHTDVQAGIKAVEEGRVKTHEQVKQRLAQLGCNVQ